jgi:tellurite resistance protein TerC
MEARRRNLKMKWFSRLWSAFKAAAAPLRKIIVAVIGGTVLLIGIALIVLPGPAFIVIPIGLAILATEFAWAGRALARAKAMIGRGRTPRKATP